MTEPAANAVLDRQKTLWRPTHSAAALAWLARYRTDTAGRPLDPARFVGTPSGLSHRDIHTVINDRSLGERFFEVHCDLLDPERSTYIDPIFGALHGQRSIRAWLVPIMSGQGGGASFDPVFPAVFMDDGRGGTSIDEWQLVQPVNGVWTPIAKGVSVRRYRDGWIRDAVDFFDTTPIRMGMAAAAARGDRVPRLPDWPRVPTEAWHAPAAAPLSPAARAWLARRAGRHDSTVNMEPSGLSNRDLHELLFAADRKDDHNAIVSDLMHPTASVYIDPIFGELRGQKAIRAWLADIMTKAGHVEFELLREPVFDGNMSYSEWRQVAVLPDGSRVVMTRGASIRRYANGWVTYAADYFDTAPFLDPAIQAASTAAGSTLTIDDVRRYRPGIAAQTGSPPTDILGLTGLPGQLAGIAAPEPTDDKARGIRAALIEAAVSEIERTGNAAISIRQVAKIAGISHNAPYFHFPDKQALLMAVAAEGMWRLTETMEASAASARTPLERHRQLGVGFVRFGLANPGLFRILGNRELTGTVPSREWLQASGAAAQLFGSAVNDVVGQRRAHFVDPLLASVAGWALVQGLTNLLAEGQLIPGMLGAASGEEVAERVTSMFTALLAGQFEA